MQQQFIEEALKTHNECRALHGCEPLIHNPEISRIAQAYAQRIAHMGSLKHSSQNERVYRNESMGENLAWAYDSQLNSYSGAKATMQWYDEIKDHNFNGEFQSRTGHFTQVVWKGSREVGFGVARANDGSFYAVANYYPAGNMMGQFRGNVPRRIN